MRARHRVLPLALLLLVACDPGPRERPVLGLAAALPEATVLSERALFKVGGEDVDSALGDGWDRKPRDRRFRHGERPRSSLRFVVVEPRALRLQLVGTPVSGHKGANLVQVEINGRRVGRILTWRESHHWVEVPPSVLDRGENELTLTYDDGQLAVTPEGPDPRPAATMRWSEISFWGLLEPTGGPRALPGDRLVIPFGSMVGFPLDLPPGAELRGVPAALLGLTRGVLQVRLESDGAPAAPLATLGPGQRLAVPLGGRGGPGVLWLAAIPDLAPELKPPASEEPLAGLVLEQTAVWTPRDTAGGGP